MSYPVPAHPLVPRLLVQHVPIRPLAKTLTATQSPRIRITQDVKAYLRCLFLSARSCPRMRLQSRLLARFTCEILDARRRDLQRLLGRSIFVERTSLVHLCMHGASLWDSPCSLSGGLLRSFSAHRARVLLVMRRAFRWMIHRSSMMQRRGGSGAVSCPWYRYSPTSPLSSWWFFLSDDSTAYEQVTRIFCIQRTLILPQRHVTFLIALMTFRSLAAYLMFYAICNLLRTL